MGIKLIIACRSRIGGSGERGFTLETTGLLCADPSTIYLTSNVWWKTAIKIQDETSNLVPLPKERTYLVLSSRAKFAKGLSNSVGRDGFSTSPSYSYHPIIP